MGKITVLGSASAVPDEQHENTHFLLQADERNILIDCAGNPIQRLSRVGVDPDSITDIILTHFHPDHVSGVPMLLMGMWLLGRQAAIHIYGLDETVERMEAMMDLYYWKNWPDFYPVHFHGVAEEENSVVLVTDGLRIFASPVRHLIPTIGLRIEFPKIGKRMAYSCDTQPCPSVVRLAEGVDVLFHEAGGPFVGHTSPLQAGEIARQAGAKSLYLIHYPIRGEETGNFVADAKKLFDGPVYLAEDLMTLEFTE